MRHAPVARQQNIPCLIRKEGGLEGTLYRLSPGITRIGRGPENDVVISGVDALVVSQRHAEIRAENGRWMLYDLQSTNGTFVNGDRVTEAVLISPCTVQLGKGGPELTFTDTDPILESVSPESTLIASTTVEAAASPEGVPLEPEQDRLVRRAVVRARLARRSGLLNQTGLFMRDAVASAVHHSSRRWKRAIAGLVLLLVLISVYGAVRIYQLKNAKSAIDARIGTLEKQLAASNEDPDQADQLVSELNRYQSQARALEGNALYRFGVRQHEDLLSHEIRTLLAEFGAESYSIPPEFRAGVQRYLGQYQGPDRPNMARALSEARPAMNRVRAILKENDLPPDFAYMVLVESALDPRQISRAGCTGLWQFTPATARAFGLRVSGGVDERLSVVKSTRAACKYIRDLILDFGAGSSVMLALAAYNVGPAKVRQAIHRVKDPIKQRSFWYLYRVRALPVETREYVPKVIAAMIIGRHPERYGF